MQSNHPILSGLVKLHSDLGGRIFENRKLGEKFAQDMKHVEAVIWMFEPSFDVRKIAIKRRQQGNPWFKRGTIFRHAVDTLRSATEPLSARDITLAILNAKGVTNAKPKAVSNLTLAVSCSLKNNDGNNVQRVGEGRPARWKLL